MKKRLHLLLALIMAAASTWATTINVPADQPTIQAAINAAADGDVIQIAAGTYTEALSVGKSLTFIGSGPASTPTTIITHLTSNVINLTVTGKSFTFQNLIVHGNVTNRGIYAGSSISINSLTMQDVIARNCKVALYFSEGSSVVINNLYFDNLTLVDNTHIGAYIGRSVASGIVTNSTFTHNGFTNTDPTGWQKVGLQFVDFYGAIAPSVLVTDCYFDDNGAGASSIEKTGLSFYTAVPSLQGSDLLSVSGCSFSNHPQYAVRIRNGYNVGNTATVNGTFSNNWLDIWFSNIIGTTSSTTLVRNSFSGIRTVGAGPTYDYSTIQAAINAANPGDIIQVAAGTTAELGQIFIDENITIKGTTGGKASLTTLTPGSNTTLGGNVPSEAFIYIAPGFTVTLQDFIIDCAGWQIHHAIQSRGFLTVNNCEIKNVEYSPYYGRGIVLYSGTGLIQNTSFSNIERIGIHVRGNVTTPNPVATIEDIIYVGKGAGTWLDYAVEFGGGGSGTVDNLDASDCLGLAGDGSTSAGVLVTDYWGTGTTATISNSFFDNNTTGIVVGYASGDGSVCSVFHCTFGDGMGIESNGPDVDAENNYWGSVVGSEVAAKVSLNVDYAPWCNSTFSICTYGAGGSQGPITDIANITVECTNAVISVPVIVTGFNNVGAISLTLNYDDDNFVIDDVDDVVFNAAIGSAIYDILPDGVITISYISNTGVNLPDGATLFTMNFTWDGAACPTGVDFDITFDYSVAGWCEYAPPGDDEDPYTNVPADFIAGNIAILRTTPPSQFGGPVSTGSTVECIADATQPLPAALPVVKDVCGVTLSAPTPVEGANPACEGTKTWTYTYEDCANLEYVWVYTYTIDRVTAPAQFGGPVSTTGLPVECETAPTPPSTLPVVKDVCGTSLSPSWDSPVIDATTTISRVDDFSSGITLNTTAAPGKWYIDRYAPAGFTTAIFDGDDRLKHSINAANYQGSGSFYNTQGRKYNVGVDAVEIKLYIPADWATSNKRMAGFWGTGINANYAVSSYPIVEFTTDGGNPRFRAYDNGTWYNMGLPTGFAYDTWVTLKMTLLPSKEFKLEAGDLSYTTVNLAVNNTVSLNNIILQGHNYDPSANQGVTYDIYWDDFSAVMCEGNVAFVYRYLDCSYDQSSLQYAWAYNYTVDHSTAPVVPADGGSIVYDIANAVAPTLPVVTDVCGVVLTGVLASVVDDPIPFTYPGTRTYTYTFTDCAGLFSTWKYIYTVPGIAVSGVVTYYKTGNPVLNKVNVTYTQGAIVKTDMTDDGTGVYTLSNLAPGTYSVTFSTLKAVGGINSTDAAQVNYWGVTPSTIEKVRWLAGNVFEESPTPLYRVNSNDAQRIQNYFLTQGNPSPAFTNGPWSFWSVGETISTNPGVDLGDPQVTITGSGPSVTQNFYGLVTGDFNRSFTPSNDGKSSESLTLNYGQTLEVGDAEFELPLIAATDMQVGAISLILNFPSDVLTVNNVYLSNDQNTQVLFDVTGDELRISWYSPSPLSLLAGERLVTLVLEATGSSSEPIYFSLAADPLNELADAAFEVIGDAALTVDVIKTTALGTGENLSTNNLLFGNYPNPFVGTTNFVYTIPTDGKVLLEVYDIVGNKVMEAVNETQSAGEYLLKLDRNNLQPGVYTATLKLENAGSVISRTIKIISK